MRLYTHTHTHTHTHTSNFIKNNRENKWINNQSKSGVCMKNATTGITLVALVITIVVLLILTGITIMYVMGDNGIFKKASDAKLKTDIASWQERLELAKEPVFINGLGTFDADEYFEYIEKQEYIEDKDADVTDNEDGTYLVTTKPGYIFQVELMPDKENPKDAEIEYIGEAGKLFPKINSIEVTGKNSNSIAVKVTVSRLNGGKLSYYYKKEEETEYHELEGKQNTEELTAEFTGLEQNKIYNIRVVVENKVGTDEAVINELTGELAVGVISQKGETTWSNEKASIELETTPPDLRLEYQVNGIEGTWLLYNGLIGNLNHKDTVYARITDGVNSGEAASIEIRDGEAPRVMVTKGNVTTNSIAVTVASTDGQWGMPASPSYSYFIKKTTDTNYPTTASYTGTNTNYTFTGLTQKTGYDIKVTTRDRAENEGTGILVNTITGTVGGASGNLTTGNIIASSPTWSGGKASITLSTTTNLQIQWQKNGISGTWTTGTSVTGLNHNDTVYARLWDGTNGGSEASVTIKDSAAPSNASITLGATSSNTGANVTAKVTHNDAQSGIRIASCKWVYNTTSGKIGTAASSYTGGTFSSNGQTINLNASSPGTYYLHVLSVDNAGNGLETVSGAVTVRQLATGVSVSPTSATINVGATKQLTATVTPTNTSNKGVTWTSSNTGVATVSSSGLVTAKAVGTATITVKTSDGSNKSATCTITVQYPAPAVSGSSTGSHTATTITYTWDQINKIAQAIANASGVNSSTTEVTATINGSSYKIGVGDIATVQYNGTSRRVRVLGFKHDDLVNTGAYGGNHSKASISFEFLDFMTGDMYLAMNDVTNKNTGGWVKTEMRKDINGYTNDSATQSGAIGGLGANLSNKAYIKQVKKKYSDTTYNHPGSIKTCNDYLWLLARSEILSQNDAASEGSKYKYYQGEEELYKKDAIRIKYNVLGEPGTWWTRSVIADTGYGFWAISSVGGVAGNTTHANKLHGVAPGFCI